MSSGRSGTTAPQRTSQRYRASRRRGRVVHDTISRPSPAGGWRGPEHSLPFQQLCYSLSTSPRHRQVGQPPVLVHRIAVGHAGNIVAHHVRCTLRARPPRPAHASRPAAATCPHAAGGTVPWSAPAPWWSSGSPASGDTSARCRKSLITWFASAIAGLNATTLCFARRTASGIARRQLFQPPLASPRSGP